MSASAPDLSIRFAGISFKNPVIAAGGTLGYGIEFEDIVTLEKLGGFVTKGLSREPMVGNPPPRLFETAAGIRKVALRMLDTPQARRAFEGFVGQWTRFDRVLASVRNARQYTDFNPSLLVSMTDMRAV